MRNNLLFSTLLYLLLITFFFNPSAFSGGLKMDESGKPYYEDEMTGDKYYDYPPVDMLQGKSRRDISDLLDRWNKGVESYLKENVRKYHECKARLDDSKEKIEQAREEKEKNEKDKEELVEALKVNLLKAMTRLGFSTAATVLDPAFDAYIIGKGLKDSIVNAQKNSKVASQRAKILGEFEALTEKVKVINAQKLKQLEAIASLEKSLEQSIAEAKKAQSGTKTSRGPPPPGKYDNTKPLPSTGKLTKSLPDETLSALEKNNGFKREHADRMHKFAQDKDSYVIVRDGNPDSVKFFDDPDLMPKPMSCKAKTAKVGEYKGLVVDPTHPVQAKAWDDAIAHAEKFDPPKAEWLKSQRSKAVDTWKKYGDEMLNTHGYQVNRKTGLIEKVEILPDGSRKVWKGVHGDYDLHGVYRRSGDGTMEHVSYGSGRKGMDMEGSALRRQLNSELTGGRKDFIQHGGQDDWIPDPSKVPKKPPDPPATVFFPDGRPPLRLEDASQMRNFYENEMGIPWPY